MVSRGGQPQISMVSVVGYALAKLIPGLLTFASIPIWLQRFGVVQYGRYSLIWAVSTVTGALFVGWIRQAVLRGAGDSDWSISRFSITALLGWSAVSAVPVVVTAAVLSPRDGLLMVTAAALGLLSSMYSIAQAQIQRNQQSTLFALADSLRVALGLAVTLVVSSGGATTLVGANALGYGVCTTLVYGVVRSKTSVRLAVIRGESVREMWAFGWPMAVWLTLSGLAIYMDRAFISVLVGATGVGVYSAVADLINRGIPMLAFPITMIVHPLVMRRWNIGDRDLALATVRKAILALACLLVVSVAVCLLAGGMVFRLLLPSLPFNRALLCWLAAGASLWQLALMLHKPLELLKQSRQMLLILCAALVVGAAVDVPMIRIFGLTGAAIGFTIAAATYCIAVWVVGTRLMRVDYSLAAGHATLV